MVRNNTNARIEEKYAFSNEHEEDNWSGNSAKLTHNGEKPYQCKKCRKSIFFEKKNINNLKFRKCKENSF